MGVYRAIFGVSSESVPDVGALRIGFQPAAVGVAPMQIEGHVLEHQASLLAQEFGTGERAAAPDSTKPHVVLPRFRGHPKD